MNTVRDLYKNAQDMEYRPSQDWNTNVQIWHFLKNRFNRLFQQVIHKGGESVINYIKVFQNAKVLAISFENIYF